MIPCASLTSASNIGFDSHIDIQYNSRDFSHENPLMTLATSSCRLPPEMTRFSAGFGVPDFYTLGIMQSNLVIIGRKRPLRNNPRRRKGNVQC